MQILIMEKRIRIPFCSTINLYIETLTGTCFELRVSPLETILSVKAKIQRIEGIPISQQHLIWEGTELEDDFCLHDYRIKNNSTIRLVIALRGGPINTRRIAVDEPSLLEMADYIDANQEEILEELSFTQNSGKTDTDSQVTLLVYRNGDQINFFRVIDRGDGALTPISESYGKKPYSGIGEEAADVLGRAKFTMSRITENRITATKMKQLQNQMQLLKLKDVSSQKVQALAEVPIGDQVSTLKQNKSDPSTRNEMRKISAGRSKAKYDHQDNVPNEGEGSNSANTSARLDVPTSGNLRLPCELHSKISFNRHDKYLRSYGLMPLPRRPDTTDRDQNEMRMGAHEMTHNDSSINPDQQIEHSETSDYLDTTAVSSHSVWGRHVKATDFPSGTKRYPDPPHRHQTLIGAPGLSVAEDSQLPPITNPNLSGKKSIGGRGSASRSGLRRKAQLQQFSERSRLPMEYSTALHVSDRKELRDADLVPNALTASSTVPRNYKLPTKYLNHCDESSLNKHDRECGSGFKSRTPITVETAGHNYRIEHNNISSLSSYPRNTPHTTTILPPVRPLVLKKRRCFCCGKKTGLATSYTCRCGENFCATHRYAETHDCTFDYKSSGRQLLKESNPIVSAPKLPKI